MEAKRQRRHDTVALYLERKGIPVGEIISLKEEKAGGPFFPGVSREVQVLISYQTRGGETASCVFGGSMEELMELSTASPGAVYAAR